MMMMVVVVWSAESLAFYSTPLALFSFNIFCVTTLLRSRKEEISCLHSFQVCDDGGGVVGGGGGGGGGYNGDDGRLNHWPSTYSIHLSLSFLLTFSMIFFSLNLVCVAHLRSRKEKISRLFHSFQV